MGGGIEILVIGRANSSGVPDIVVPAGEDTVGRRHAELTLGDDGNFYLVDLGSANGTFVMEGNRWKRIQQASVTAASALRLGEFQTTVADLLRLRKAPATPPPLPVGWGAPQPVPPAKPVPQENRRRRNPITGEVE